MSRAVRMAYLVLAHDNAAQLDALVEALLPPGSPDCVVIHADRRSPLWSALLARAPRRGVIVLPDPVAVRWGHASMVTAMARLIDAALTQGCDAAHLLSGADWPVASRAEIAAAFASSPAPCCIEAVPGVQEDRMQGLRLDSRWLRLDPARDRLAYATTWELRRLSGWLDRLRGRAGMARARPWGEWRKGSQWWSLPRDALELLAAELPRLLASGRLSGTLCADEHVIQTIVAAHFPARLAGNRRFIDWPREGSSPRTLGRADLPAIAASDAWFARKFDSRSDAFFLAPDCFARVAQDAGEPRP